MTAPYPDFTAHGGGNGRDVPPRGLARWKLVGPGIVVAATGVGAGDLVATSLRARASDMRYSGRP